MSQPEITGPPMTPRCFALSVALLACSPAIAADSRLPGFAVVSGEGRVRVASLDRAAIQGFRQVETTTVTPPRPRHPIVPFLRDRTMRVGDTVVLEGRAVTLRSDAQWPLSIRDFEDFRTTKVLRERHRGQIEDLVRVGERETKVAEFRKSMTVVMMDDGKGSAVALRGPIAPSEVRIVALNR